MAKYHKYVFDIDSRSLVGKFEEMYRQENVESFDSWHQDDSRQLNRKIALDLLSEYNFANLVDLGCGKGALTHKLKKCNNHVLGLDISPTAIGVARTRFPDIEFHVADFNDLPSFTSYLDERYGGPKVGGGIDLVFSAECLSYIERWKELISEMSRRTSYLLVNLFLPENPIGFVKTPEELETEIGQHYEILELVTTRKCRCVTLFARSR